MSDSIQFPSFIPAVFDAEDSDRRRGLGLCLALIALWFSTFAWAQDDPAAAIAPGVVPDRSMQRVYLLEPEQLTARAIASGELIWSLSGVVEPLGLAAGRLLALRAGSEINRAELLMIDSGRGVILGSEELVFPEDVRVRLIDGPGEKFQARLVMEEGVLRLAWDYSRHPLKGALAVSGANRPPKMPRRTGLVLSNDPQNDRPDNDDDRPMASRVELSTYRSGVIELALPGTDSDPVQARGTVPTAEGLIWRELRGTDRLSGPEGRQFFSAFSGATLVSALQDSPGAIDRYRWTVLDAQGESIGQYESAYAFAPFTLIDDRLAYVADPRIRLEAGRVIESQELALIVIDLANGREAWQAALLDKAWREGMPP
jgi:hypothetical protein